MFSSERSGPKVLICTYFNVFILFFLVRGKEKKLTVMHCFVRTGRYMSPDLQELRHDRGGGTVEPVCARPEHAAGRRFSAAGGRGRFVGPAVGPAGGRRRAAVAVLRQGPEAQEQKVPGQGAAGEDVQGEGIPDTDAAAGVGAGRDLLQVQAAEEVHAVPVQELETPFARRRRGRQRRERPSDLNGGGARQCRRTVQTNDTRVGREQYAYFVHPPLECACDSRSCNIVYG